MRSIYSWTNFSWISLTFTVESQVKKKITDKIWAKASYQLLGEILYSWSRGGKLVIPKHHPWGEIGKTIASMGKGAVETFHWYESDPDLYAKHHPKKYLRLMKALKASLDLIYKYLKKNRYENNLCRFCGGPAYPCIVRHIDGKSCA